MEALEEKAFILNDKKLRNLKELRLALIELSDDDYSHYANSDHNYFADWIEHVLEDKKLADSLRITDSRTQAIALIEPIPKQVQKAEKKEGFFSKKIEPSKEIENKSVKKPEIKIEDKKQRNEKTEDMQELKIEEKKKQSTNEILKKIEKDEQEIKTFLWHHHPWEMAKEFMYGMALGVIIGLILSRVILP